MSALAETVAELRGIVDSLPHHRRTEFDAALEAMAGQVGPILRTSRHHDPTLARIQQIRSDAAQQINGALMCIAEQVEQAILRLS